LAGAAFFGLVAASPGAFVYPATPVPYPILLLQKAGQGHGIGNSFAQRVADTTATLAWFDSQLR
jgi:hypothetical protein